MTGCRTGGFLGVLVGSGEKFCASYDPNRKTCQVSAGNCEHQVAITLKPKPEGEVDGFFENNPDQEEIYQMFKARLILELKVTGSAYSGVVRGKLEDK